MISSAYFLRYIGPRWRNKPSVGLCEQINIYGRTPSVVLEQACICSIPDTDVKRLIVWTQRYTRYLAKHVNFLTFSVLSSSIVNVDKICRFSHHQEPPIWWVTDWSDSTHVSFQHCCWRWQVSHVPNSTGFVLIPSGKGTAIRVPGRRERIV